MWTSNTLAPKPAVRGYGSHGGYCGPAVKPIALNMVAAIAADPAIKVPISGIGGIQAWQDAVEFLLLGAGSMQVCTAVMHYGFRIVEHLQSGLEGWMRDKGYRSINEVVGLSVPRIKSWGELDLNYKIVARIDQEQVHSLRALLYRLRRRLPPVDSVGPGLDGRVPGVARLARTA